MNLPFSTIVFAFFCYLNAAVAFGWAGTRELPRCIVSVGWSCVYPENGVCAKYDENFDRDLEPEFRTANEKVAYKLKQEFSQSLAQTTHYGNPAGVEVSQAFLDLSIKKTSDYVNAYAHMYEYAISELQRGTKLAPHELVELFLQNAPPELKIKDLPLIREEQMIAFVIANIEEFGTKINGSINEGQISDHRHRYLRRRVPGHFQCKLLL